MGRIRRRTQDKSVSSHREQITPPKLTDTITTNNDRDVRQQRMSTTGMDMWVMKPRVPIFQQSTNNCAIK